MSSEGAGAHADVGACRGPRGGLTSPRGHFLFICGRGDVREAAGPFRQARDARCKEVAVLPPKSCLCRGLTWESRWEADAPSFSGKDGVWKSDEELRQWAGLLGRCGDPGCSGACPPRRQGSLGSRAGGPHPVVPLMPRWRPHVSPALTTMCRGRLPVERA